jgi:hypothetical protein
MGANISLPEDNQAELTSEAVVGIIGKSYYDQAKWIEVTGDANVITVEELRRQIDLYKNNKNEAAGDEDEGQDVLNQESTMELDDETGDRDTASYDDDESGTQMKDESSLLLDESTRDVDDFTASASIYTNRVVEKLPEEEFNEKHRRLKILYQSVRESRVDGVIARSKKKDVIELRELMTIYYDQTNEFFIMKNRKEKMSYLISEYYFLIDHHPKGRDFMRFYGKCSRLKISGLHKFSDIDDAKPIAIALLVCILATITCDKFPSILFTAYLYLCSENVSRSQDLPQCTQY